MVYAMVYMHVYEHVLQNLGYGKIEKNGAFYYIIIFYIKFARLEEGHGCH